MSTPPLEIDAARALVLERAAPLGTESVPLADALGRVLGADVSSADPVPGFDNSAMDGYAVRAADTHGPPKTLRVVDESRAGHPAAAAVGPGEAIAISTGAMLPDGADAVIRVEDTDGGREAVAVAVAVAPGNDVRRAGEDIAAGDTVLRAGAEIGPAEAGVLASCGRAEVDCARRPRVAVLTTGDELQEPGTPLAAGAIRNSNAYTVGALVGRSGGAFTGARIVGDDRDVTRGALAAALEADIVVVCGGVSVGEHDHVRPALDALGVEQVFWRVALRPGAPTYFGVGERTSDRDHPPLVFGLPGNPVSAMVTFLLFARPAIRAQLGAADDRPRARARLGAELPALPARTQLVRVRLELADDGWIANPTKGPQGSHVLTSMVGADALAVIPPSDGPYAAGAEVEIELLP